MEDKPLFVIFDYLFEHNRFCDFTQATPENLQAGEQVIVPPPATSEAAEARMNEGHECIDWYFCKKSH